MAAASLLENPTFHSVIKSIGIDCFAEFTESQPSQPEKREAAYHLYRAIQAIEYELSSRIQAKDQAVAKLDAELAEREDIPEEFTQGNTDQ